MILHSTPHPSKKRSRPVGKSRRSMCTGTLKMCSGTCFFRIANPYVFLTAKVREKAFAASSQLPRSAQLAAFGTMSYGRVAGWSLEQRRGRQFQPSPACSG